MGIQKIAKAALSALNVNDDKEYELTKLAEYLIQNHPDYVQTAPRLAEFNQFTKLAFLTGMLIGIANDDSLNSV